MQNETIDKLKNAGYITVTDDSQGIADKVGIGGGGGDQPEIGNNNVTAGSIEYVVFEGQEYEPTPVGWKIQYKGTNYFIPYMREHSYDYGDHERIREEIEETNSDIKEFVNTHYSDVTYLDLNYFIEDRGSEYDFPNVVYAYCDTPGGFCDDLLNLLHANCNILPLTYVCKNSNGELMPFTNDFIHGSTPKCYAQFDPSDPEIVQTTVKVQDGYQFNINIPTAPDVNCTEDPRLIRKILVAMFNPER